MELEEILRWTRAAIREHAGDDSDKLFYANRYVFARLQLDERKVKTGIKKQLLKSDRPCAHCGEPFDSKVGLPLHRIDGARGYSPDNCVLMHPECHKRYHAEHPQRESSGEAGDVGEDSGGGSLVKYSKRYDTGAFRYWWDITPKLAASLGRYEAVEFVKKDAGERCSVPPQALTGFLTDDRQTSRGDGNWGIKVLADRPEELAFEPARKGDNWLFLPVAWLSDDED